MLGESGVERGGGLPGVRRADPVPVPGADVAVVRQQPGDRAAVVAGVAARAARLGLVPPGLPVRCGVTQLGQRPGQVPARAADDRREPAGIDVAPAGARLRAADLVPQFARGQAVQAGQPGQVGGDGFVPGGRDGDREPHQPASRWPGRPRPAAARGGAALGGVVDRDGLEQVAGDLLAAVVDGAGSRAPRISWDRLPIMPPVRR